MSRTYDDYDAYGEPRSVLKPAPVPPCPLTPTGEPIEARFEREASACIDAESVYEDLRHQGFGHTEARAIVAERFKV
ncbi:MAG: hypothetical protein KAY22_22865 [Rhizorhabdus sp.]|uniref:hypothetical protein n=1 Tax=Rhizorhabdus sp. TaxID=1968843 RepID=UPI001B5D663E|nr:hypothetical protein [Rhizorhabdus sp.]MBP8235144.1 hypothetical protein [Rhizorhabdus sp.]